MLLFQSKSRGLAAQAWQHVRFWCDSKGARRRGTSFEEGPMATTERRGFVVGVVSVGSQRPIRTSWVFDAQGTRMISFYVILILHYQINNNELYSFFLYSPKN